jgi:hypothetical protein
VDTQLTDETPERPQKRKEPPSGDAPPEDDTDGSGRDPPEDAPA